MSSVQKMIGIIDSKSNIHYIKRMTFYIDQNNHNTPFYNDIIDMEPWELIYFKDGERSKKRLYKLRVKSKD